MAIALAGLLAGAERWPQGVAMPAHHGSPGGASAARRFECARPAALRLRRFEDGSAQLWCGGALLARVSSPG